MRLLRSRGRGSENWKKKKDCGKNRSLVVADQPMRLLDLMLLLVLGLWSLGLLLLLQLQLQLLLLARLQENMCQGSDGLKVPALMHHLNLIDGEAAGQTVDHPNQTAGAVMIADQHLEVQGRRGPHPEFPLVVARNAECVGGSLAKLIWSEENFGFDQS